MILSIVIPCYDEMDTILALLDRVLKAPLPAGVDREVVVVDDFSVDGTRDALAAVSDARVRVLLHDRNRGKGAALRTGFAAATGGVVVVQDADLEYNPEEYAKLLKPILDGRADVVYGSRFTTADERRVLYYFHYMGNRFLTFASNVFTNMNLSDMETCYKMFRKEILDKIRIHEDRFGFEPEITAKIARLRCRVYEVGISYSGRTYEEGKKIGFRDGIRALWCIVKYNIFSRK
ncbi:MAG TPA: glycosyltransferase family 2 protein [Chitinivibrionales bacterium]|jgi:glycosyltransferase involved in cell wall biosynthesis|nr:glycosyltransferase family 2 protein [Chitinivibrionales bacterium]